MEDIQLYSIHTVCPTCKGIAHATELMTEDEVREAIPFTSYDEIVHACLNLPGEYETGVYHFNTNTYVNKQFL